PAVSTSGANHGKNTAVQIRSQLGGAEPPFWRIGNGSRGGRACERQVLEITPQFTPVPVLPPPETVPRMDTHKCHMHGQRFRPSWKWPDPARCRRRVPERDPEISGAGSSMTCQGAAAPSRARHVVDTTGRPSTGRRRPEGATADGSPALVR